MIYGTEILIKNSTHQHAPACVRANRPVFCLFIPGIISRNWPCPALAISAAQLAGQAIGWPLSCYIRWPNGYLVSQAILGLTFSWGVPVAASLLWAGWPPFGLMLIYIGTVFWVIGYDTIYAIQDMADDKITGVKSSALTLGRYLQIGVASILWHGSGLLGHRILQPVRNRFLDDRDGIGISSWLAGCAN